MGFQEANAGGDGEEGANIGAGSPFYCIHFDPHVRGGGPGPGQALGPLDRRKSRTGQHFVDAKAFDFQRLQAVEVEVCQSATFAVVLGDQRKRRRLDPLDGDAERSRHTLDQHRLASPEITMEQDHTAVVERPRDLLPRRQRLFDRMATPRARAHARGLVRGSASATSPASTPRSPRSELKRSAVNPCQ
jgi:hypothetical protein